MDRYILLEGKDVALYKFCGWFDWTNFSSESMFRLLKRNNINSIEELAKVEDKKLSRLTGIGPKRLAMMIEAREYARSLVEQGGEL